MDDSAAVIGEIDYVGVNFMKQLNGYNRAQVDSYIESLAKAYELAYDEYYAKCDDYDDKCAEYAAKCAQYDAKCDEYELKCTELNNKCAELSNKCAEYDAKCAEVDELLEGNHGQEGQEQDAVAGKAIASALIKSELLAKQTLDEAKVEAERIIALSLYEAEQTKEGSLAGKAALENEAQLLLSEARIEASRIINEAHESLIGIDTKTSAAAEEAKRIIDDAKDEAARIRVLASRSIEQAFESIEQMLNEMQGILTPREAETVKNQNLSYLNPYSVQGKGS